MGTEVFPKAGRRAHQKMGCVCVCVCGGQESVENVVYEGFCD